MKEEIKNKYKLIECLASEEGRHFLYNRKPTWWVLRDYINEHEIGDIITRQGIFKDTGRKTGGIDSYINALKNAQFIETVKRGQYKILHKIPDYLSFDKLFSLAFEQEEWKKWFMEFDDRLEDIKKSK